MSTDPTAVSGAVIAQCCGITRRQHNNLVNQGVMPASNASKKYSLVKSMRAFLQYRISEGPESAAAERLKHMKAKTRKLELDNANQSGDVIEARAFADTLQQLALSWRSGLQRIAKRSAPRAEHKRYSEILEIIDEEARTAGQELSETTGAIASKYQAVASDPDVAAEWFQVKTHLAAADLIAMVDTWKEELARANNTQLAKLAKQVDELGASMYRRLGMLQSKTSNRGDA